MLAPVRVFGWKIIVPVRDGDDFVSWPDAPCEQQAQRGYGIQTGQLDAESELGAAPTSQWGQVSAEEN